MEGTKKLFSPDNLSFGLVLALAFLTPIFFLPLSGLSPDVSKIILSSSVVLLALVLWLFGRLVDGVVKLPKSIIIAGVFALVAAFLASSIASPSPKVSFFGQGFEVGTFSFILVGALASLVTALTASTKGRILNVYLALVASFAVIAVYQGVRLFVDPATLSLGGIFTEKVSNLVGKWNDLGIFFGLIAVLSLAAVEIMELGRKFSSLLYAILAVSVFFLAVINFTLAWGILAAMSLVVLVYSVYLNKFEEKAPSHGGAMAGFATKAPGASIAVLLVSLMFLLSSGGVSGYLSSLFKTSQVEVRPSWSTTFEVGKSVFGDKPIFGIGPNRFSEAWLLYKPAELNNTIFWATDFNAGVGLIPTFAVTGGVAGTAALLFFFAVFLFKGARSTASLFGSNRTSQYLVFSSFLGALYLWVFTTLYVPNAAIMTLAFLMTGLFVASLVSEKLAGTTEFSLLGNPKIGFVSVLAIVFLIVSSAAFGYVLAEKTLAIVNFQKAAEAMNTKGDLDAAEGFLLKAAGMSESDAYYRGLSQISLARVNNLFSQKDLSQEEAKTQFTNYMGAAIQSAKQAIAYDSTNYVNWLNLGGIYEAVTPLGINGASDEAGKSYAKALELAPKNPYIYYSMGRLEVANKKTDKAREYLNKALALKSDYTDALFFLSQIEASEGNLSEAISKTEQAALLAPDNSGLFFQLGLLKYNAKDYQGAISALERASSLSRDYANAMYFLGLSYDKVGRKDDALKQFTRISELNPDNAEVTTIIKNLKAGKSALSGVSSPNNAPEKNKTPPIKETKNPSDEL